MCANLALSVALLGYSEDILDGKLDGKLDFFAESWSIKLIAFMKTRIAEKKTS